MAKSTAQVCLSSSTVGPQLKYVSFHRGRRIAAGVDPLYTATVAPDHDVLVSSLPCRPFKNLIYHHHKDNF